MMKPKALRGVLALSLLVSVCVAAGSFRARGQQPTGLSGFMRQKLAHSQKVLEGLTLENYAMIVENAEALKTLSQDARWQVSPNINYLRMSSEFQDQAAELATKAKQKNLDGATLAYLRLTMSCVKCHQFTRDNRLTGLDGAAPFRRIGD